MNNANNAAGQQTPPLVGRIPDVWEKPSAGKRAMQFTFTTYYYSMQITRQLALVLATS
jgi:hypothetical protein